MRHREHHRPWGCALLEGRRSLSVGCPDDLQHNQRDISCGVPTLFASAVESSLGQDGGITDVILVIQLKVFFDPRAGNRE